MNRSKCVNALAAAAFVCWFSGCNAPDAAHETSDLGIATTAALRRGPQHTVHRASANAPIERHGLEAGGLEVFNFRIRVRTDESAPKVIDEVIPPPGWQLAAAALTAEDAKGIARSHHPTLKPEQTSEGLWAERDPAASTLERHVLSALRRVWRVDLMSATGLFAERRLMVDAVTGDVVADDTLVLHGNLPGHGLYSGKVLLDGSVSVTDPDFVCLRDPDFTTPPYVEGSQLSGGTCGAIQPPSANQDVGVAVYRTLRVPAGVVGLEPIGSGTGALGTGGPNLDSAAVDAYVGLTRAIDFYSLVFGRTAVGSTTANSVSVNLDPSNAPGIFADKSWVVLPATPEPPQTLGHEYTHLVLIYENVPITAYAIQEGIADIFALLIEPTMRSGLSVVQPPARWDEALRGTDPPRYFDWPGRDGVSPSVYDGQAISLLNAGADGGHAAGGVIRRWFYVLSNGLDPENAPPVGCPRDLNCDPYDYLARRSPYLPAGMAGIGVDIAARILYKAVVDSGSFRIGDRQFDDLRVATIRAIDYWTTYTDHNDCHPWKQSVQDAWAAVHVGEPADRTAPTIEASYTRVNGSLLFDVTVRDTTGLGDFTNANLLVNGVPLAVIPLTQTAFNPQSHVYTYHGTQDLPQSFLTWLGPPPYTIAVQAWDACGYTRTVNLAPVTAIRELWVSEGGTPKHPVYGGSFSDGSPLTRFEVIPYFTSPLVTTVPPFVLGFDTSGAIWPDGSWTTKIKGTDQQGTVFTVTRETRVDNTPPIASLVIEGDTPPFRLTGVVTPSPPYDIARLYDNSIDSPILHAEFRKDGVHFFTDASEPYNAVYSPSDSNPHVLSVAIQDLYGNIGIASAPAPLDHVPPAVTLIANQTGLAVALSAVATDTCGIERMQLRVDGVEVVTVLSGTWTGALPNALFLPGVHTLAAEVRDRCGNTRNAAQFFTIYTNVPTATAETILDPAHPKAPKIRARVIHDRPITKIQVWRAAGSGGPQAVLLTEWNSPGELNPIRDFTLDTSGADWGLPGSRSVYVRVFDHLGLSAPSPETYFWIDNANPTTEVVVTGSQGRLVHGLFKATDFGPLNSDNMQVMTAYMSELPTFTPIVATITRNAPPWQIEVPYAIPNGAGTRTFQVIAMAKDKYGNMTIFGHTYTVMCPETGNCTFN